MKTRIKYQGMAMVFSLIVVILNWRLFFPVWKSEGPEELTDLLGLALLCCGFLVRIVARNHKKEASQNGHQLVTSGIYRLVRNPMYIGTFLIGTGIIVTLFQWWIFFLFLAGFCVIYLPQIRREEQWLVEQFPVSYPQYQRKTRRWIPTLQSLFRSETLAIFRVKPGWFKNEFRSFVLAILVLMLIETAQDVHLFGSHELTEELIETLLIIGIPCLWFLVSELNPSLPKMK
ncbi:MAG: isoprenylcysteine carboxylmethyltransferase family protein [Candidatus Omnitrophica bacterium]|nr:isoprenylcysteine carboxylmethyltransferase family protein [Candidatus Omnitrophota bacterium]